MSNSENSKRIAKNTILLYFRMFLTMGVSLYTSRVVLNTLGVADFGIYNVVGGVVMMLSFLNASMSSATQRFISFELGKKDFTELKRVFGMSVNIHAIIALTIFILAETLGLWFLNSQLNIPDERMGAANWVYQFSIFSFVVSILNVPYNATIIAHERMGVYAYISIVEVSLKLLIVFALVWIGFDKLKLYAILTFVVSSIIRTINKTYCKRNFEEAKYSFFWDKNLYKTLMSYAGWNLFGNIAAVLFNQGINILLNIFFGPIVNAARGIAYQVNGAISGFVSNFQMSMNPQIVKSYAAGDHKYMQTLIFQGSKYSFFLLFLLSLPVLLQTELLLKWWLKTVPEHTVIFCQLVLINTLINCLSGPLMTAAQATGNIKKYQAIVGGILLLNLPVSYIFLKLGFPPETTLVVSILLTATALIARILIIKTLMEFSAFDYLKQVIGNVMIVAFISCILPYLFKLYIHQETIRFFIICITSAISVFASIYFIGLKKQEQDFLKGKVQLIVNKLKK